MIQNSAKPTGPYVVGELKEQYGQFNLYEIFNNVKDHKDKGKVVDKYWVTLMVSGVEMRVKTIKISDAQKIEAFKADLQSSVDDNKKSADRYVEQEKYIQNKADLYGNRRLEYEHRQKAQLVEDELQRLVEKAE